VEDEKKLIIFKIIRFGAYHPVAVIDNDSEEDVQIQGTLLFIKSILRQSDALSSVISAKEPGAAANKISKKKRVFLDLMI